MDSKDEIIKARVSSVFSDKVDLLDSPRKWSIKTNLEKSINRKMRLYAFRIQKANSSPQWIKSMLFIASFSLNFKKILNK